MDPAIPSRMVRFLLLLCFVGGAVAAVGWWWLMPQGFPISHLRFWSNGVFPLGCAGASLWGIILLAGKKDAATKCVVVGFCALVLAAGVSAVVLYPESVLGSRFLLAGVLGSCLGALVAVWGSFRALSGGRSGWSLTSGCILLGGLVGVIWSLSQRAAEPGTRSGDQQDFADSSAFVSAVVVDVITAGGVKIFPWQGAVSVKMAGTTAVEIYPLLTFVSRSPDRFWTVFAPKRARLGPQRSLVASSMEGESFSFRYEDDGRTLLEVTPESASAAETGVRIEAVSQLPRAVFSHLNTYSVIHISGCDELGLSFSPCPGTVKVMPFDYPVGRPARLCHLDADNVFRVVEASSGEKGPFEVLAEGKLADDEPLAIEVCSGDKVVGRIVLEDWAKQASRQLSPTAGWGVAENAIEFSPDSDSGGSATIYLTLASTSVGRGWDSVGHSAGTYTNAMRIESPGEYAPGKFLKRRAVW